MHIEIDHINMTVANLAASKDWYQRLFGFVEVESGVSDDGPWSIIRNGSSMLCLYQHNLAAPDSNDGAHRVYHFGLRVHDRAAWEALIAREKLKVMYGGAYRYPHSTSWYVIDPSGYEIEVSYWDNDQITF